MEVRKITADRRLLAALLVLFVLPLVLFAMDWHKEDVSWQERRGESYEEHLAEEQRQYRDGFGERIAGILAQADSMDGISIFAKEDSFSRRNAQKTREAFEPLLEVEPAELAGRSITELFEFGPGNLCALLGALSPV